MALYAFLARHANQQVIHLLGRQMTFVELTMFYEETMELLKKEPTIRIG